MNVKSLIKKFISGNNTIYSAARKWNYYWYKTRKWNHWQKNKWSFDVLHAYADYKSSIKFIQIGSNDGMHGDPICNLIKQNGWQGILVEPVPYLFENLKKNYLGFHDKLFFENSAIANENGTLKFYRLKKSDLPNLPEWYDQLGSFKKEIVLKHRTSIPFFDDLFIEDSVTAITFKDLIEKYSIKNLNLVHIDTEGYDYEIIKMLPLVELNIDLIQFEHKHLSEPEYKKAVKLLRKNGYKVRISGLADTVAIKKSILNNIEPLAKKWAF